MEMENDRAMVDDDSRCIIQKPGDPKLVERLKLKLAEYKNRLIKMGEANPYRPPEHPIFWGTRYKIALLEGVLEHGSADTRAVSLDFYKQGVLNIERFNGAAGAIADYCRTGGKHVEHSTGLPPLPLATETPPTTENPLSTPPHQD